MKIFWPFWFCFVSGSFCARLHLQLPSSFYFLLSHTHTHTHTHTATHTRLYLLVTRCQREQVEGPLPHAEPSVCCCLSPDLARSTQQPVRPSQAEIRELSAAISRQQVQLVHLWKCWAITARASNKDWLWRGRATDRATVHFKSMTAAAIQWKRQKGSIIAEIVSATKWNRIVNSYIFNKVQNRRVNAEYKLYNNLRINSRIFFVSAFHYSISMSTRKIATFDEIKLKTFFRNK